MPSFTSRIGYLGNAGHSKPVPTAMLIPVRYSDQVFWHLRQETTEKGEREREVEHVGQRKCRWEGEEKDWWSRLMFY